MSHPAPLVRFVGAPPLDGAVYISPNEVTGLWPSGTAGATVIARGSFLLIVQGEPDDVRALLRTADKPEAPDVAELLDALEACRAIILAVNDANVGKAVPGFEHGPGAFAATEAATVVLRQAGRLPS